MRSIEELSETIIGVLSERSGFDDWWYNLDEIWQEEILEDLQETIKEWTEE
jgi:hypothetical protein